jgi:propanol-preferring alcohol dehydrogenase
MKAARLHEVGKDLVIEDVPEPVPGPGEVLVRIGAAGACHSDLHLIRGRMGPWKVPAILGHENAGWVESTGPGVHGVRTGEPVAVFGGWGCGSCRLCLGGQEQLCDPGRWAGMGPSGGYAELLLVPSARHLVPLGDLDPVTAAPLTDAGVTPYHAVKRVAPRLHAGTTAVVVGAGGLGQYAVQFLGLLSPARVVVVDKAPDKRETALQLGAALALDPDDDVRTAIREVTEGEGAAVVLDFVGVNETLALATRIVGIQGIVVLLGLAGGRTNFSFVGVPHEATLTTSSFGTRNDLAEVVAIARQGRLASTVESRPLEEINQVFDDLESGAVAGRAVLVP